jgi:hypothetical protein
MIDIASPDCKCVPENSADAITGDKPLSRLCSRYILPADTTLTTADLLKDKQYVGCVDCMTQKGYWSAIGCIQMGSFTGFVSNIFGPLIGIAGLFSMGCIIYSSILIQVSRGNPEAITNAQEMITSCITGLLMIIFSVFILRLIGVDILRIPGFS